MCHKARKWVALSTHSCYAARDGKGPLMHLARLKQWREQRLLTQAELAQRSGVAETTINRIENGRHEPRFSTIRKLAAALDVAPEALMGDEGQAGKRAA